MNHIYSKFDAKEVGQFLIIGALLSIAISPPLTNLFIALTLIWIFLHKQLRHDLTQTFTSKTGVFCIAFIAIIIIGIFYSVADINEATASAWGWRKFLMLPVATSLFLNSPNGKRRLLIAFLAACTVLAIYSYLYYLFPILKVSSSTPGIVVRNHVTQTIFFSVALIISIALLAENEITPRMRNFLQFSAMLLFSNIILISLGRSGYVALIVMIAVFILLQFKHAKSSKKLSLLFFSIAIITTSLLLSPTSRDRIKLAQNELISGISKHENTSTGLRITFYKTSAEMIPKYWIIGTGTGGFETAYRKEVPHPSSNNPIIADPHNQYLKILIEHGIFGLLIFFGLIYFIFSQKSNPFTKNIGISVLSAFLITSIINSHFSTFSEGQFIWLFIGAMFAEEAY